MNKQKKISIVIPAYNEEENIKEILRDITANPEYEVIVVDDGSTDNTAQDIASFKEAFLIKHPYNIGNGASVREGIEKATGDIIVCMDADGQHDPADIPKLLEYFPEYDMVIGSRVGDVQVSRFRSLGNRALKKIAEFLSGHKIDDLTSGFRAMKREKVKRLLHLFPIRYSYPTTTILSFLSLGYSIKYMPLSTIARRVKGKSNIRPIRDSLVFVNIMFRMIMLFNPQKIFTPISFIIFSLGSVLGVRSFLLYSKIVQSSAIMIIVSVIIFLFGLFADMISTLIRRPS